MRAYFDWAASAPPHPLAKEAALLAMDQVGNPSSAHAEGRRARDILEVARGQVAALVGCSPREVFFTASGTEANALGIMGGWREGGRSQRLLHLAIEHPSVLLAAKSVEGAEVVTLPSRPCGSVDLEEAERRMAEGARLVAVQLANNETGVIQPVADLAALAANHGARVHCDAVQALGKLDLSDALASSHTLSLSAHKIGGIPGAGALIAKRGAEPHPVVPGHQEGGIRGGTESLAAIAAFGAVAAHIAATFDERRRHLVELTSALEEILRGSSKDLEVQGDAAERVPGIVNATFPGVDGETLLVALDLAGIACSHGAACSTGAMEPSHVLLAMGRSKEAARSTLRFSVGERTSDDDLLHLSRVLPRALASAKLP